MPKCPQSLEVPEDECLAAGKSVASGYTPLQQTLTAGAWGHTPCGCFLWKYNGNYMVHYDRGTSGCVSSAQELIGLVCKANVDRLVQQEYDETDTSQQFKLNDKDQLESVGCPGKVITAFVFKCYGGAGLILGSDTASQVQKWRFYENGIVNLACGRKNGNLAITAIEDNSFDHIPHLGAIRFSLVNPSSGKAIGVGNRAGAEVSCYWMCMLLYYVKNNHKPHMVC